MIGSEGHSGLKTGINTQASRLEAEARGESKVLGRLPGAVELHRHRGAPHSSDMRSLAESMRARLSAGMRDRNTAHQHFARTGDSRDSVQLVSWCVWNACVEG